jgi:uncharacterized short protein YbdD (DUF466 family)
MLGSRVSGKAGKRVSGEALAHLSSILRQICGMPRYAEYLKHMRSSHPEAPLLSEEKFYDEYLRNRYAEGSSRCC